MIPAGIILRPLLSSRDHHQICGRQNLALVTNFSYVITISGGSSFFFLRNYMQCKLIFWLYLVLLTAAAGQGRSVSVGTTLRAGRPTRKSA